MSVMELHSSRFSDSLRECGRVGRFDYHEVRVTCRRLFPITVASKVSTFKPFLRTTWPRNFVTLSAVTMLDLFFIFTSARIDLLVCFCVYGILSILPQQHISKASIVILTDFLSDQYSDPCRNTGKIKLSTNFILVFKVI